MRRGVRILFLCSLFLAACSSAPTPGPNLSSTGPDASITVERMCDSMTFTPAATLRCDPAIDLALSVAAASHWTVAVARFTYWLGCANSTSGCPYAGRPDRGFVILTLVDTAAQELVRVKAGADGSVTSSVPEPYVAPSAGT